MSLDPAASSLQVGAATLSDASFERPSPLVRVVWILNRSAFWLVVITGLSTAHSFGMLNEQQWLIWVFSPSPTWLVPPMHIAFAYLSYRGWGYQLRQHDLLVRHGVITRRTISIPLARIQQVDTSINLFERLLGLTRLVVHTAGTRAARTLLPGLRHEQAAALRDALSRKSDELAE